MPESPLPTKKIVVVEADEDVLHLIQMTLADCGAEVLSAGSGSDGQED